MLSRGELKLFEVILRVNSILGNMPIEWDFTKSQIYITSSRVKHILNTVSRRYTIAYVIFILLRLYPAFQGYGTKYPKYYLAYHTLYAIFSCWGAGFKMAVKWHAEELVTAFNQMVWFNRRAGNVTKIFLCLCTYSTRLDFEFRGSPLYISYIDTNTWQFVKNIIYMYKYI